MSDSTVDPSRSASFAPAPPAAARSSVNQTPPPAATPDQNRPSASPQPPESRHQQRPVWMVIGALVIVALVFGGGFLAGRQGAANNNLEQTTVGVISQVDPSVVQVQGRGANGRGGLGSGEILTSSGYIVTNSHVVHGLSTFAVLLSTGQTVPATLVGDVPTQDLAVLKVTANDLKPITVGDSSQVQVGAYAIAMGSPLGLEQSATTGIISALNRDATEMVDGNSYTLTGMIQTSAPINPGNSGGALVNSQGQLIGIPTLSAVEPATQVAANGIGFAIASNQMEAIVSRFIPAGS